MRFIAALSCLSMAAVTLASPVFPLEARTTCTTPSGAGTCEATSSCTSQGFNLAGYCSGPANIQCCIKKTCSTSSGSGICMNTNDACRGSFVSGACPGDSSIKCCVGTSSGGGGTSGSGAGIVSAAEAEKGLPYVYGGGGCAGPSGGGFDCSGLTQYAVCHALKKTIPRTADTQYASSMGKHLPRESAQAGDMLFWATGGDCSNAVSHVGIFVRAGIMVVARHTGTFVQEQAIWISSDGESICPDAVRFW